MRACPAAARGATGPSVRPSNSSVTRNECELNWYETQIEFFTLPLPPVPKSGRPPKSLSLPSFLRMGAKRQYLSRYWS